MNDGDNLPNIIVILTDDQGAWALGSTGNHEIETGNLDQLAATGVRFENFFCTSPVCSPARASLLTGKIPSRHGVHDFLRDGNVRPNGYQYLQDPIGYTDTLAQHGYRCGLCGKWHLGDSLHPQKSFSHWYAHEKGSGPYYAAPMVRDGVLVVEDGYVTDLITDDAIEFMEGCARENTPFCLSLHYTAPHSPWIDNHPQEIVNLYEDCPFETCKQEEPHPWNYKENPKGETLRESLKGYFAAVTAMDRNIGRVIQTLERLGIQEDTFTFFTSDNGFNCGHHGIWGKGNGTFPQNMFDTSVKVPAIMHFPGRIPEGMVCEELVSAYDFMPTLLDFIGLEKPDSEGLPGRSAKPLLTSGRDIGREHVVVFSEYGPVRMIRTKEWKYVHRFPYGPHELYHLSNDPEERENLYETGAANTIVGDLRSQMEGWFIQYVDPYLDGSRLPITGMGQLAPVSHGAKGALAFNEYLIEDGTVTKRRMVDL